MVGAGDHPPKKRFLIHGRPNPQPAGWSASLWRCWRRSWCPTKLFQTQGGADETAYCFCGWPVSGNLGGWGAARKALGIAREWTATLAHPPIHPFPPADKSGCWRSAQCRGEYGRVARLDSRRKPGQGGPAITAPARRGDLWLPPAGAGEQESANRTIGCSPNAQHGCKARDDGHLGHNFNIARLGAASVTVVALPMVSWCPVRGVARRFDATR